MNEQALVVLDQLTKSRTIFRRTSFALGFTAIAAPMLFILGSSAWQVARNTPIMNIIMGIVLVPSLVTPTILALAFTFLPLAIGLRNRTKVLREAIESESDFMPTAEALNRDAKILKGLGFALLTVVIVSGITFLLTKDLKVEIPLRPGECCLSPDGESHTYFPSPWAVGSAFVLFALGPYTTVMGTLSLIAAKISKKRSQQLVALS